MEFPFWASCEGGVIVRLSEEKMCVGVDGEFFAKYEFCAIGMRCFYFLRQGGEKCWVVCLERLLFLFFF